MGYMADMWLFFRGSMHIVGFLYSRHVGVVFGILIVMRY